MPWHDFSHSSQIRIDHLYGILNIFAFRLNCDMVNIRTCFTSYYLSVMFIATCNFDFLSGLKEILVFYQSCLNVLITY